MKITGPAQKLHDALSRVSAVVPKRAVKPILTRIKCVANGDLKFQATDLEVSLTVRADEIKVEEPGEFLLPLDILKILKAQKKADVALETKDDSSIFVRSLISEFELPTETAGEYPTIPDFPAEGGWHEIKAGDLDRLIARTEFACANAQHTRFGATVGFAWEVEDALVRLVTTDGRRLAIAEAPAESINGHKVLGCKPPNTLPVIPQNAMKVLQGLLDAKKNPDEIVRVHFPKQAPDADKRTIIEGFFQVGSATIYTRLCDGRFPNWNQAIPQCKNNVDLEVESLLEAINQAKLVTNEECKRVVFAFGGKRFQGDVVPKLIVSARSEGRNAQAYANITMPELVKANLDRFGEISFDPQFLIDCLKVLKTGTVKFEMQDGKTPAIFSVPNYRYVVVPLVAQ